jgi:thioesterase domain-containing protein
MFSDESLDARQSKALGKLKETADGMEFEELLRICRESGLSAIFDGFTDAEVQLFATRLKAHDHAWEDCAVKRISIPLHIFAAEESPSGHGSEAEPNLLGWDAVVPIHQIQVIQVPGNHQTMMENPNVAVLGETLSQAIAQATGGAGTETAAQVPVVEADKLANLACD